MVGNLSKNKCKIFDVIKTVEISKDLSKLTHNLVHIHGLACGVGISLDCICKTELTQETVDEINEDLNKDLKEKVMVVAEKIQKVLEIDDKFFICDIDKNIINIFDISYNEFLDKRGFMSEDFTKIVLSI